MRKVSLPVRVTLLQNDCIVLAILNQVSLPVRVTLLQNKALELKCYYTFHYQSG